MTRAWILALTASAMAAAACAAEMAAGEAELSFGPGFALWKQARLAGKSCSDFAVREEGLLLDTSRSKAAELKAAAAKLVAGADCSLSRGRSKHGDETVTIENGLVRAVVVPALGGRIIEISNKATGRNVFIDNYQGADARPDLAGKMPEKPPIGGWCEGVDDEDKDYWRTPHQVSVVKQSPDEVTVKTVGEVKNKTWDIDGTVTVERTIGLKRGSAVVALRIKLTNHSAAEREMRFRNHSRHSLGKEPKNDEFWLSSLGYACYIPAHEGDAYATVRAEPGLDTWQAILDRDEREGVVILPGGEINGNVCIWGEKDVALYTYETNSELREHVVDGSKIEIVHDYAPALNFDAVSFASRDVAVCFMPQKSRVAPGEKVACVAAGASLAGGKAELTLKPRLARMGRPVAEMAELKLACPLLVAEPSQASITIPDVPAGRYDLEADVMRGNEKLGTVRHEVFVSDRAGILLKVLTPADDGYGKGLAVTGRLEDAAVTVERAADGESKGVFKVAGVALPWSVKVTAAGKAFKVETTTDFSALPAGSRIASYGLTFPVNVGDNAADKPVVAGHRVRWEHAKVLRTTVGGTFRDDQYMLDQHRDTTEQDIPYYYLSDGANRFPLWRFGGVLQTAPTSAWIWKAAGDDVAPIPVQTESSAPGWVDVFSPLINQGVLVYMPGMAEKAPKELLVDGEAGTVSAYFLPPHVTALDLKKAAATGRSRAEIWGLGPDGKASFTVFVHFHSTDYAGDATKTGNRAETIRELVGGMK